MWRVRYPFSRTKCSQRSVRRSAITLSVERIGEPPLFDMIVDWPAIVQCRPLCIGNEECSPPVRPRMTKSGRTRQALFDLRLLALATSL
jgi:hypothetical protein